MRFIPGRYYDPHALIHRWGVKDQRNNVWFPAPKNNESDAKRLARKKNRDEGPVIFTGFAAVSGDLT